MVRRTGRAPRGLDDYIFDTFNAIFIAIVLVLVIYPLFFILSASFSDPLSVLQGKVRLLPFGFSLEGYTKIFKTESIWTGYANTIFVTGIGTILSVSLTVLASFVLSRKSFPGKNLFMAMFVFTMFFSGGMIPIYLVVKRLHLLDTRFALIIPRLIGIWEIIIMRTFIQTTVPRDLDDAAQIDGCSNFRYLVSVIVPLVKPIIAVVTLFYAVNYWNAFFKALIYITNIKLYPLQLVLRNILLRNILSEEMTDIYSSAYDQKKLSEIIKYGVIIVSSAPMLILYPFLQKYFIKGIMLGSIKG